MFRKASSKCIFSPTLNKKIKRTNADHVRSCPDISTADATSPSTSIIAAPPMPPSSPVPPVSPTPSSLVDLEVLLPTGILIPLQLASSVSLADMKTVAWSRAASQPLFDQLGPKSTYRLSVISRNGTEEFIDNESEKVVGTLPCPIVSPSFPRSVRVSVAQQSMKPIDQLNRQIGRCLGISIERMDAMEGFEELTAMRKTLVPLSQRNMTRLQSGGPEAVFSYMHAAQRTSRLPACLGKKLDTMKDSHLVFDLITKLPNHVDLNFNEDDDGPEPESRYTLNFYRGNTILDILGKSLIRHYGLQQASTQSLDLDDWTSNNANLFLLKSADYNAYLLNYDAPVVSYRYVQDCITRGVVPLFQLVLRKDVVSPGNAFTRASLKLCRFEMPQYTTVPSTPQASSSKRLSLHSVEASFSVTVLSANFSSEKLAHKLYIRAGLFQGCTQLCHLRETTRLRGNHLSWEENLKFQISLADIPVASRLCLAMIHQPSKKINSTEHPVGWVNVNLFNFRNILITGRHCLPLAPYTFAVEAPEFLYPDGDVFRYNLTNKGETSKDKYLSTGNYVEIEFQSYSQEQIAFPVSSSVSKADHPPPLKVKSSELKIMSPTPTSPDISIYKRISGPNSLQDELIAIVSRDPLQEMYEQDKSLLWTHRELCKAILPNSLPRLAQSVNWTNRSDVASIYQLLKTWPLLPPVTSLELLGVSYKDTKLREFAVHCLEKKLSSNETELMQYLLQLTQVIKFEPYLWNRLTEFLLTQTLANSRLGLAFFWYLRSEMHNAEVHLRFAGILEALCRGCGPLLPELMRQTVALEKMVSVNEALKRDREEDQQRWHRYFDDKNFRQAVECIMSPMDRSTRLERVVSNHCKVLKSKKSPLLICWTNEDQISKQLSSSEHHLIFKHGDDLRQDMLTLQLIRIMDEIWKEEGMDMKLVPYSCLATGNETGLIEAVREAKTVMAIQKCHFKSAIQMDPSQLHRWIREGNPGDLYDHAIDTFTRSCAGYCVATFVLGIRDRHPDNIMLNKSGQLFHIDFGHFLNNRKKKFGINRERVPFVLTEDFVCVIARGADRPYKSREWSQFLQLCGEAYVVLRRHANLFLVLFTLMLHCGLPELTEETNLEYLRKTFAVESSEEEALVYFQGQLKEAYSSAWTTKVDWFAHFVKNSKPS